jgi:hypothetical protein
MNLQEHLDAISSRKPVAPVTHPAVQRHLDPLKREAADQGTPPGPPTAESPVLRSRIAITSPAATRVTDKKSWSREKRAALESIVAAATSDSSKFTKPGSHGHVVILDFQLTDPKVILLVSSPNGDCVLGVGFDRRASSRDPYVAYPTANCLADPDAVTYYDKLVQSRKVETRDLLSQ